MTWVKLVSTPLPASGTAAWEYAACHSLKHECDAMWKLYGVAFVLTPSVQFWTIAIIMPTNKELLKLAKIANELEKPRTKVFAQESVKVPKRWDGSSFASSGLLMVGTLGRIFFNIYMYYF